MKRISTAVIAAALSIGVAGTAHAETTGADSATTTTVAARKGGTTRTTVSDYKAKVLAWQESLKTYLAARKDIAEDFRTAVATALADAKAARTAGTSKADREAATAAAKSAIAAAKSARDAALAELGDRPVRPTR